MLDSCNLKRRFSFPCGSSIHNDSNNDNSGNNIRNRCLSTLSTEVSWRTSGAWAMDLDHKSKQTKKNKSKNKNNNNRNNKNTTKTKRS